jgi:hypothetical protein
MNGESGRLCLVVLFKLHAPLKWRSADLEIDASTVLLPIAIARRLEAASAADFLVLRGRLLQVGITLLIHLMGHFGIRIRWRHWLFAGRHGGVVCQNAYTRGTARISHVTIGSFGFSE